MFCDFPQPLSASTLNYMEALYRQGTSFYVCCKNILHPSNSAVLHEQLVKMFPAGCFSIRNNLFTEMEMYCENTLILVTFYLKN